MRDSSAFDRYIKIAIAVLLAAIIVVGAIFGWTVYRDRKLAENATPALRVINVIKDEVKAKPNDAMLRVRLGEALVAASRQQEAIEQFNEALKIEPKHTGALLDLGQLAMADQRFGAAEGYFNKVLEYTGGGEFESTSDRREIAYFQLGLIALQQKAYEDAAGFFKAALRIRKDASDTYYYLALALDGAGSTDAAIQQLNIALAFDPNFGQAHYYLGQMYLRRKDEVRASAQFELAKESDPNAKEPKEALAKFGNPKDLIKKAEALRSSDMKAAVEAATIARNVAPGDIEIVVAYARIIEASGNPKGALVAYKDAQKLASDNAEVNAAVKRLTTATKK